VAGVPVVVQDDPPQDEDTQKTEPITGWDAEFVKVDQATLFEMILAANFLDIKRMLDLTCKSVAEMIKGKTPEEIRKHFNIKNVRLSTHYVYVGEASLSLAFRSRGGAPPPRTCGGAGAGRAPPRAHTRSGVRARALAPLFISS
jgi:hypothetical protein